MADAGVRHFKCATLREGKLLLEMFRREPAATADLLVAYPLVGPALERLGEMARGSGAIVSVLCEDTEQVGLTPPDLDLFVDINPGMNRTGIPVADHARIAKVLERAGDRCCGLHYYDGHLAGLPAERRREA